MNIDLHSHTTASDGSLTPTELVNAAHLAGVDVLAITDHDTLAGIEEARVAAAAVSLKIVSGIELSTYWKGIGVHILGLNIDEHDPVLHKAVSFQQQARLRRAARISERLTKLKIYGSLEGAQRFAGNSEIGRPHFAQYLVEAGYVKNIEQAFKQFLGAGKAGDIKDEWLNLEEIINVIHAAKGLAVLAHPVMYKLTATQRKKLAEEFKSLGGDGMEVVTMQRQDTIPAMAHLCQQVGLLASRGSDYHGQMTPWITFGRLPLLPKTCQGVWSQWQ
jgi:predicted metal-dependent phosphoesterase TrpH